MLINLTNHPSKSWHNEQLQAAEFYGEIVDVPFPDVNPLFAEKQITDIADDLVNYVCELEPDAVLCQGEFSLAYAIIKRLTEKKITVLAACSARRVIEEMQENGDVKKICIYNFVKFRKYN